MATPRQLELPFRSLDFPGRHVLTPVEVSQRLGISLPQVHALLEEGELTSIDVRSAQAQRKTHRIPIESYRDFVVRRLSGTHRHELLRQLPRPVLEELHRDLARILAA